MNLTPAHQKVCPVLTDLLKKDIPATLSNATVFKALLANGAASRSLIAKMLTFGTRPNVKVKQLTTLFPATPAGATVHFGNTPNQSKRMGIIEIDRGLIRMLEVPFGSKHTPTPKEPVATAIRQLRRFVWVTLLHELVHFARNEVEAPPRFNSAGHEIEDGWQFERDAGLAATPMAMFYGRMQWIEDAPLWMALPEEEPLKVGR